jgi:hypothetical protein
MADPATSSELQKHRRTSKKRWHCLDCGFDTIKFGHYSMVRDDVWAASGCSPHGGMLCLYCLQKRLGRPLKFADFTAVVPSAGAWSEFCAAGNRESWQQLDLFGAPPIRF